MTKADIEKHRNEDNLKLLISQMQQRFEKIAQGGGTKKLEKLRDEGKMSARERVDYLVDKGSEWLEIGAFAGYEMYTEHGGCPAGGVVYVGIGYVKGRQCMIMSPMTLR
jgi:3-methylcrotonyl-CoA carboxylase beta subunit